ncbi:MAG: nuclear transport factor 2 family protein [Anaerolineae bacterium]|nr:nuclear transport factor 2 family protein [Gemmatimonadaceae bacterium]
MSAAASSSTTAVAQELVELCRAGKNLDAIEKFYSPQIVSIESMENEAMPAEMKGIDAIREKNKWWVENNEVHSAEVNGPFVGDREFAVQYTYETTFKPTGERMKMTEMALYTVEGGKIVKEHFFYKT